VANGDGGISGERGQGIAALIIVVVPTESAPAGLSATAIGLATLVGEVIGGTLAPVVAGAVANRHGLAAPLWIAAGGAVVVFLLLRETAPSKVPQSERAGLAA
jgi:sugar phosphate permease